MNKKTWSFLALTAGAAVAGIYSAVRGKGPFNKKRFVRQHDAVIRYIEAHHPGAFYAPIEQTPQGWATVLRCPDGKRTLLYLTHSDSGVFIFHESDAL